MCQCWVEDPAKRPDFKELVVTVTKSLEGIAGYMDFTTVSVSASQGYNHLTGGGKGYDHPTTNGLQENIN